MPRVRFHLKRLGQFLLMGLGGIALVGPTVVAFARQPPAVATAMKRPYAVMRVHPFEDLRVGLCMDDPPVHRGPIERTGPGIDKAVGWAMDRAAFSCLRRGTDDHFVLTVSLDSKSAINSIETDGDPGSALARCAASAVYNYDSPTARGPGRMRIGYFMGRDLRPPARRLLP